MIPPRAAQGVPCWLAQEGHRPPPGRYTATAGPPWERFQCRPGCQVIWGTAPCLVQGHMGCPARDGWQPLTMPGRGLTGPSEGGRGRQETEPTLTFFLRSRWTRAASCTVLSVSAWQAGASETWAIMVVRQLGAARHSRSSRVSLCSLGARGAQRLQAWGGEVRAGGWAWGCGRAEGKEGGRPLPGTGSCLEPRSSSGIRPLGSQAPGAQGSRHPDAPAVPLASS